MSHLAEPLNQLLLRKKIEACRKPAFEKKKKKKLKKFESISRNKDKGGDS